MFNEKESPGTVSADTEAVTKNLNNNCTTSAGCQAILDAAVSRLGGKREGDNKAKVLCPCHEDKKPSLSLTIGHDGSFLVHCHAGCSQENVIRVLKDRDLWPDTRHRPESKLPPGIKREWKGKPFTDHWTYRSATGDVLGYVARYDGKEGKEVIPYFKKEGDKWKSGAHSEPRPLYRLDHLTNNAEKKKPVFVCEGEKTADAAARMLGNEWAVTTWPGGCEAVGKADWTPLKGRIVFIWPDADEPGHKAAHVVKAACIKAGAEPVNMIPPPATVAKKWDLADAEKEGWDAKKVNKWIADNATTSDLPDYAAVKIPAFNLYEFLSMEIPERGRIIDPIFPEQGLCQVYGPRGMEKTYFLLSLGLSVADGSNFLSWSIPEARRVLYIDGEMPAAVMRNRLGALEPGYERIPQDDYDRFKIITPDMLPLDISLNLTRPDDQAAIEPHIEKADLIIIDSLATLCRHGDGNKEESWRPMQDYLMRLRKRGKSVIFAHHAGKGGQQRGTSAKEDILDLVINMKRPNDYEEKQGARFNVIFEKSRGVCGEAVNPFECQLIETDGVLHWAWKALEDVRQMQALEMQENGLTVREIAEELGISKSTAGRLLKKME